jgi:hypothetical protein
MEVMQPPMSARMRWSVLWIALALLGVGPRAHAGAWNLAPGEFEADFRGSWFSADTYHDETGGRKFIVGGGLWEQRALDFHTELGWKPKLNFLLDLPVLSVSRRLDPGFPEVPTQTGLGDLVLGLRYRLMSGSTAAALQVDWKLPMSYERNHFLPSDSTLAAHGISTPLDSNAVRQLSEPVLGDGQQDVTVSLLLGEVVGRGFAQVAGGYKYRFEDPSDQLVLSADAGFWMRSLLLGVRYQGEVATGSDLPTADPDEHRVGPWLVYRVDDHMDLFAGSLHTFSAANQLHKDEIQVGFAFRQTKLGRSMGFLGGSAAP